MTQRRELRDLGQVLRAMTPRLAGASVRQRAVAIFGALVGIGLTGLISAVLLGASMQAPVLVAPIGASAVLLFVVPTSPLAQPWSIVGGNTLSALTAVAVIHLIPQPMIAAAVAVALAIAVMSLTRSLHPPGGAIALLIALLDPEGPASSPLFALAPVGLNSLVILLLGYGFHKLSGHTYPHVALPPVSPHGTTDIPPQERQGVTESDIDVALAGSGESFDIGRDDLARLIRRAERAAVERTRDVPRCADVMSRDVLTVRPETLIAEARLLLLDRNLRTLPVIDGEGRVAGVVGLRNLQGPAERVGDVMLPATVASADDSILALVDPLTDGRTHAAVIADPAMRLIGLITQTDLIAVLARLLVSDNDSVARPSA